MSIQIKKIKIAGNPIYPATNLDAVKDATAKITVDGVEKDNPTYGKTVREIIEDNEKVTATALTELDTRVGALTDLSTTEKSNVVKAINEVASNASGAVGDMTTLTTDKKNTVVNAINEVDAAVDKLNGDDSTEGSVAYQIKQTLIGMDEDNAEGADNGVSVKVAQKDGMVDDVTVAVTTATVTYTAKTEDSAANLAADSTDNVLAGDAISAIKNYTDAASATAVQDAIVTSVSASTSASDAKVASEKATATAIENAIATDKVTISPVDTGLDAGVLKSYKIYQGGSEDTNLVGTINIPKDCVLTSGSVVNAYKAGDDITETKPTEGTEGTDYTSTKALKLVIANQDDPIYIDVNDLVDKFNAASLVTDKAISHKTSVNRQIDLAAGTTIENALDTIARVADANAKDIETLNGDVDVSGSIQDALDNMTGVICDNLNKTTISNTDGVVTITATDSVRKYGTDGSFKYIAGVDPETTPDSITFAKVATTGSASDVTTTAIEASDDTVAVDGTDVATQIANLGKAVKVVANASAVEDNTSGDGKIKIGGTEYTVYTHPTYTEATAAAVKVGRDATGHVVLGDALAAGDITAPAVASATDSVAVAEGTVASLIASLAKSIKAAEHTKTTVTAGTANGTISVDGGADVTIFTETDVTVATDSNNYLGASKHEISVKTSDIEKDATGLATAADVYAYAVTAEDISDTTEYADVF